MLKKPHWTLGLEIGPHHFQLLDRYHEELVNFFFGNLFDDSWGVFEIDWDARALTASGELQLLRLGAILPDGTPIACGTSESPAVPVRTIPDFARNGPCNVYIGVPLLQERGANVDDDGDPKSVHRYAKETSLVPDYATGTDPVRVEWLRPNVWLLFEGERLDRFSTIHVARTIIDGGEIALDPTFVPPALSLRASRHLEERLREVLEALVATRAALERGAAHRTPQTTRLHLLEVVSAAIPQIDDLIDQTHVRPREVYRALAPLLASLAVFTRQGAVEMPKFNFLTLADTFEELFKQLAEVFATLAAEQHRLVPLGGHDACTWYAELAEPTIFRNAFFLCVFATDVDRIRTMVPHQVKLAAWNELGAIQNAATGGIPLHPQPRAPGTVPDVRGAVYFALDKAAPMFASVMKTGQLGLFVPPGLGITDIALYVVDPGAL